MDKQRPQRPEGAGSAGVEAEWAAAMADRLIADGAEAGRGAGIEGLDGLS